MDQIFVREFWRKNGVCVYTFLCVKFKHDDSEVFEIIEKELENLENQSNGLLMV
jgi:hypothetical protein